MWLRSFLWGWRLIGCLYHPFMGYFLWDAHTNNYCFSFSVSEASYHEKFSFTYLVNVPLTQISIFRSIPASLGYTVRIGSQNYAVPSTSMFDTYHLMTWSLYPLKTGHLDIKEISLQFSHNKENKNLTWKGPTCEKKAFQFIKWHCSPGRCETVSYGISRKILERNL